MWRASSAFLPRMRSTTRRAFWGETRTKRAAARTDWGASAITISFYDLAAGGGGFFAGLGGVPLKGAGGGELAQLVPDHVLGQVDGDELFAVVDGDGVAHELAEHGGAPR